jgi:hypothetical protein
MESLELDGNLRKTSRLRRDTLFDDLDDNSHIKLSAIKQGRSEGTRCCGLA